MIYTYIYTEYSKIRSREVQMILDAKTNNFFL